MNLQPSKRHSALLPAWPLLALVVLALACEPKVQEEPPATRRLAVLAPALGEMLHALDLDDHVVAVGAYGPWPPGWEDLPQVGTFDQPSLERLKQQRVTDVVTTQTAVAAGPLEQVERLGMDVFAASTDTFEGTLAALTDLGQRYDRAERAAEIERKIRAELADVERAAQGRPTRSVVVVVGRDPLYVAGPNSHFDTLLRVAGGHNLFGDLEHAYAQVSMEALLERSPEVILDCSQQLETEALDGKADDIWAQWSFLPAVQNEQVFRISSSRLSIPGVRLGEMAHFIQARIHPELSRESR